MKHGLSTDEMTDIARAFYRELKAATTNTAEMHAVQAIVQILVQAEGHAEGQPHGL